MTYGYDAVSRVTSRLLNGAGTTLTYDALGRISQLAFPIGNFAYTFDGHTGRTATVTYPNSQTTTYTYLGHTGDHRLQTIHHKDDVAALLSKFAYTYDAVGNIKTWRQERAGSAAKIYEFANDAADQLTAAVLKDTNPTPTILKRQAWAYDPAGNRTVDQADDAVFATSHDNLNHLQSRAPGGPIVMSGAVNEAATVTIDGKPATVDASNNFTGTASIASGTTTVTVKAKDPTGNETTKQYEIDAAGSTTSYSYDANGNLTSDGTKMYFWNALNQLVEMKQGMTTLATFVYDGAGRRTEKNASGVTHTYIYDSEDIVEERLSGSGSGSIRYFHGTGIDEPLARKTSADVVTYYLADHLGSIVQETDATAAVTLDREYDPWGNLLQGASASGFAFTGREWDDGVELLFVRARYYSPGIGRFLSEDPVGFSGGLNWQAYVSGAPVGSTDPFGLQRITNKTNETIRVKLEAWDLVYVDLKPGATSPPVDGALTGDKIIKINNNVNVTIGADATSGKHYVDYDSRLDRTTDGMTNMYKHLRNVGDTLLGRKTIPREPSGIYDASKFQGRHGDWMDISLPVCTP